MNPVVYKLGGSLLDLPDLAERLMSLLAEPCDGPPLVVVGGGRTADLVREWDRRHSLGEERSHRLALRAMMLNEAFVLELLPESRLVRTRDEAAAVWDAGRIALLCAHDFLAAEEPASAVRLPHTWEVTSDSIAAWIAIVWPARELVLLKSCPQSEHAGSPQGGVAYSLPYEGGAGGINDQRSVPESFTTSAEQIVDSYFSKLAPLVSRIRWCDLRTRVL